MLDEPRDRVRSQSAFRDAVRVARPELAYDAFLSPFEGAPQERHLRRVAAGVVQRGTNKAREGQKHREGEARQSDHLAHERNECVRLCERAVEVEGGNSPHTGSFRKIDRGTCRSTVITYRSVDGTHTVCARRARPRSIASATSSGVVARGAGSIPSVIFECTNPGRTTITCAPDPTRLSPRPWKNASMPALDDPYTKFERRARSPATDDSATITPCPCARSRCAMGTPTDTAPR